MIDAGTSGDAIRKMLKGETRSWSVGQGPASAVFRRQRAANREETLARKLVKPLRSCRGRRRRSLMVRRASGCILNEWLKPLTPEGAA